MTHCPTSRRAGGPHSMDRLMDRARGEALKLGNEYVGTDHLLLALSGMTDRPAGRALAACGVDPHSLRAAVLTMTQPGSGAIAASKLVLTPRARLVLARAAACARQLGHDPVLPEHVLVSLLADPETVAFQALVSLAVKPLECGQAMAREAGWPSL